jgi:hypothetical protein
VAETQSRGSAVGIATDFELDDRGFRAFQTDTEDHPTSCELDNAVSLFGDEVAGT